MICPENAGHSPGVGVGVGARHAFVHTLAEQKHTKRTHKTLGGCPLCRGGSPSIEDDRGSRQWRNAAAPHGRSAASLERRRQASCRWPLQPAPGRSCRAAAKSSCGNCPGKAKSLQSGAVAPAPRAGRRCRCQRQCRPLRTRLARASGVAWQRGPAALPAARPRTGGSPRVRASAARQAAVAESPRAA